MWMSSSSSRKGNRPSLQLELDRVETTEQRVAILRGDDLARRQHLRVRARLRDVLRPQPPVEADRGVQAPEVGMLGLMEAGHWEQSMSLSAQSPAYRPNTARSASPTRVSCPSLISGKNGSASERSATSSQTGNSPSR